MAEVDLNSVAIDSYSGFYRLRTFWVLVFANYERLDVFVCSLRHRGQASWILDLHFINSCFSVVSLGLSIVRTSDLISGEQFTYSDCEFEWRRTSEEIIIFFIRNERWYVLLINFSLLFYRWNILEEFTPKKSTNNNRNGVESKQFGHLVCCSHLEFCRLLFGWTTHT